MTCAHRTIAAAIATTFLASPLLAAAADPPICGPLSGVPKLDYAEDAAAVAAARVFGPAPAAAFASAGLAPGVTFDIEYTDVVLANGVGFDDATLGATRRATAEAVFDYISSVLPQSGSAQITFQASETDGTGFLGQAQPLGDITNIACQVVYPIKHIRTGIDPDATLPDGIITLDFGYPYNDDLGPVGVGEYDLFSLILHEATHSIAFVSSLSIDDLGNGPLGLNPDIRVIGFDDFIQNSVGTDMISCPSGTFVGAPGPIGDLVGPPSLLYTGPVATAEWQDLGHAGFPPLYTPTPHAPGSSATHWDTNDPAIPADAVMIHTISLGGEKRVWSTLELGVIHDLGYFETISLTPALGPAGAALLSLALAGAALPALRRRRGGCGSRSEQLSK